MSDTEDHGTIVWRLAKQLTPPQLAELLALHAGRRTQKAPSFLVKSWRDDPDMEPLVTDGLMGRGKPPKGMRSSVMDGVWITELGVDVLLCRVGWELTKCGAIPTYEDAEE